MWASSFWLRSALSLALLGFPLFGHAAGGPAPEFPAHATWLNSPPLTLQSQRGKVVLLDFWTFECWNCYRSFPWLNAVELAQQPKGLSVIGIHTPEFAREKVLSSIRKKVAEYGLRYPVMVDNDHQYWNAMHNQYWPAFYLIDRKGQLRAAFFGETHAGDAQAEAIEAKLAQLLAEPD